jgi:RecQ family ATP-dependent DNA helicase
MLEHVLRSRFGHEEFKPLQKQACEAILECKDVCLLMATGFGKSLCYQLPAVHSGMPAVVVSPLISLMEDQVMHLNAIGVSACFLNSAQRDSSVWNEAFLGKFSLIYTSPETLDSLWDKLVFMESIYGICCFAVDESHCVSEWGHDFRPAYRRLGTIREKFPQVPIIAATASATNRVLQDIVSLLHLKTPLRLRSSLDRSNLEYLVKNKTSLDKDITVEVLGSGPAIIYCITRESTDKMHSHVCSLGINAVRYHAGLSESERRTAHRKFLFDEVPVIVATIAFGLGVNKSVSLSALRVVYVFRTFKESFTMALLSHLKNTIKKVVELEEMESLRDVSCSYNILY